MGLIIQQEMDDLLVCGLAWSMDETIILTREFYFFGVVPFTFFFFDV